MIKSIHGLIIVVFLFLIPLAFAQSNQATIQGTIYNIFLEELDKAVITINSSPEQTEVSKNGSYAFTIPAPGTYTLTATYFDKYDSYEIKETIEIKESGTYKIDLILIPSLDTDLKEEDTNEFDYTENENEKNYTTLIIILFIIILIVLYIIINKKKVKESDIKSEQEEELDNLHKFIKENGGRATQKEIRKKFPSSEAKVSLMITELESKGKVRRIKRGRSNIIIIT
jgi:uncharacterized membrane protein